MLTDITVSLGVVAAVAGFWSLVVNRSWARRHRQAFEAYTNAIATLEAAAGTEVAEVEVCIGDGQVTRLPVVRPGDPFRPPGRARRGGRS